MNLMIMYERGLDSRPDGKMKMSLRVLNYGLKLDNIFMSMVNGCFLSVLSFLYRQVTTPSGISFSDSLKFLCGQEPGSYDPNVGVSHLCNSQPRSLESKHGV